MSSEKQFTNRLISETSPYLQQHAHNPVDWFPWGDEAFEKAADEDKPVLVSIGYSACHWCHVMETESFEDEATAQLMNEHFVNIKVDMEERPDIDKIYMSFVQMTTGHGGWPMNVFLTPDKLPFFGGTYFPPVPRYNMPSFQQILLSVADAYRERRDDLAASAAEVAARIRQLGTETPAPAGFGFDELDAAYQSFKRSFDAKNGGFGGAPKFPPAMSMEFLLRCYHRTGKEEALEMVRTTALKMADGGIYDQLGGGFHRYSVDAVWLVPHFEKMLYDNAQLARVYLHLWQITGEEAFRSTAVETLEYVQREMLDTSGGFYSSQDADSEGVEGKFFVWTPQEIENVLGEEDATLFNFFYDVSLEGNFEEKNILHKSYSLAAAARAMKIGEAELQQSLRRSREKLFAERERRVKPFRDEKILTAWNALMLAAFAEASAVLGREDFLEVAIRNADFLLANLKTGTRLLRTWKDGRAKLNAYVEDYANLIDGLIELYQVSGVATYLTEAKNLADTMIAEFWDEETGGFFFTSSDHEKLLVRSKEFFDNATPSGNSVAAEALLRLFHLTGEEKFQRYASTVLRLVASQFARYPQGFGRALAAAEYSLAPVIEIALIGDDSRQLSSLIWQRYLPNKVVAIGERDGGKSGDVHLLAGRTAVGGEPTAYVCRNFVCERPAVGPEALARLLDASTLSSSSAG